MAHKLGPPGEFGPEHTGYMGDSTDWIGWVPQSGQILTSWPVQSWPSGTVQLPVHLDSAINGAAGGTYQESPLSQPQQISTDLTIPADNPLFQLQIPGVQATVVVQVAAAGLSWWVHAGSVGQVPSSLHPQGGSTVTLSRLAPVPYVIPAGSVVSTAFDPAA